MKRALQTATAVGLDGSFRDAGGGAMDLNSRFATSMDTRASISTKRSWSSATPTTTHSEKEFRGFAFVEKLERGDEALGADPPTAPGRVTRIAYHQGTPDGIDNDGDGSVNEWNAVAGAEEEALKGMVLWRETAVIGAEGDESYPYDEGDFLPDDDVFSRAINQLTLLRVHAASGGLRPERPVDPALEVRFPSWSRTSRK